MLSFKIYHTTKITTHKFGKILTVKNKSKTIKMYLFNTILLRYLIIRKISMKNGFNILTKKLIYETYPFNH